MDYSIFIVLMSFYVELSYIASHICHRRISCGFFKVCLSLLIYHLAIQRKKVMAMAKQQSFKRKEIKYILTEDQYLAVRQLLRKYAQPDAYGLTRINNIYYDTPDYLLIRNSLEKPVYKEKLRLRTYGDTNDSTNAFVEIKKKYNGIVYKRRFATNYLDGILYLEGEDEGSIPQTQVTGEVDEFLKLYKNLRPKMVIGYDRIALAGIDDPDFRVTFDSRITWRKEDLDLRHGSEGCPILEEGQYLMEMKIKDAYPLEIARAFSELNIFPTSVSKYGKAYISMISENTEKAWVTSFSKMNQRLTEKKGDIAYA